MMKVFSLFLVMLFNLNCAVSQEFYKKEIKNLSKIKAMPYIPELSGDDFFWDAVKCKIDIVSYLIEMIDNEKKVKANVHYYGGNFTVGDVAYHVIMEIIRDIPTLDFLKQWKGFDENNGYGNYWNYVRESKENRKSFKIKVKQWYEANKVFLVWIEDSKFYLKEDKEGAKRYQHPAGGYYKLKQ